MGWSGIKMASAAKTTRCSITPMAFSLITGGIRTSSDKLLSSKRTIKGRSSLVMTALAGIPMEGGSSTSIWLPIRYSTIRISSPLPYLHPPTLTRLAAATALGRSFISTKMDSIRASRLSHTLSTSGRRPRRRKRPGAGPSRLSGQYLPSEGARGR